MPAIKRTATTTVFALFFSQKAQQSQCSARFPVNQRSFAVAHRSRAPHSTRLMPTHRFGRTLGLPIREKSTNENAHGEQIFDPSRRRQRFEARCAALHGRYVALPLREDPGRSHCFGAVRLTVAPVGLALRPANRADCPLILEFIRGLAEYEKLAHEVEATVEALEDSLFGAQPAAEVLIAEYDGAPAAFALFFMNYSTFLAKPGIYLEDLFVKPDFRRKGIGEALLARLAAIAVERGCGRFEWWVLDWNEPAIGFYRELGAVPMDEWTVFRVTGPALGALAARDRSAG